MASKSIVFFNFRKLKYENADGKVDETRDSRVCVTVNKKTKLTLTFLNDCSEVG